jgi:hypothetical protein
MDINSITENYIRLKPVKSCWHDFIIARARVFKFQELVKLKLCQCNKEGDEEFSYFDSHNDTRIRFTKLAKKFHRGANIHKCNKRLFYVQTHYFLQTIDVTTALRAAHVSRAVARAWKWNGSTADSFLSRHDRCPDTMKIRRRSTSSWVKVTGRISTVSTGATVETKTHRRLSFRLHLAKRN